jgi:hypothetical protein
MKRIVFVIFAYCCVMTAALLVLLVLDIQAVNEQGTQLAIVERNLAELQAKATSVQNDFDDLARQQRLYRGRLEGEDAIVVSQAVQQLSAQLTQLRNQEQDAQAAVTSNSDLLEKQQLQFIPYIALLLMHCFSLWIFWPWRVYAIETRKPKPQARWKSPR